MERVVDDGRESLAEAVRAAESLVGLDVTLRLQNDPNGALRIRVFDARSQYRREYAELELEGAPPPDEIVVVAELSLHESAVDAGHLDLVDDVVSGLEEVFPGGVAHSPMTGEVILASEILRIMDPDQTRWSHVDVRLALDSPQREYVLERLQELPESMQRLVRTSDEGVLIRGRFPSELDADQVELSWQRLLDLVPYARAGHVRFREGGMWQQAVEGLGSQVAPPPAEWLKQRKGVRGTIARWLGRK